MNHPSFASRCSIGSSDGVSVHHRVPNRLSRSTLHIRAIMTSPKVLTPSRRSDSFPHAPRVSADSPARGNATATTTIKPLSEEMTSLIDSIVSKQSCLMQPPVLTLTLYIPTASVGGLMGRRGQAIAQLQQWASRQATTHQPVRISVVGTHAGATGSSSQGGSTTAPGTGTASPHYSTAGVSSPPPTYTPLDTTNTRDWTPVVVRADPRACLAAALHIQRATAAAGHEEAVVLDVPLSRTKHAAIVGKRGLVLANMSADHGTRIMVPSKLMVPHSQQQVPHHNVVQLEGALWNVMQCLERLLSVALTAHRKPVVGDGRGVGAEPSATVTLAQLPAPAKLRAIAKKTSTSIQKRKAGSSGDGTDAAAAASIMGGGSTGKDTEESSSTPDKQGTSTDDDLDAHPGTVEPSGQHQWEVTITGTSQESVQTALDLLRNSSSTQRRPQRRSAGRGGGGKGQ